MPRQSWITLLNPDGSPTKLQEGDVLWFDGTDSAIHITRSDADLRLDWGDSHGQSRVTPNFGAGGLQACGLQFALMLIAGCAGFALEGTALLSRREGSFRVIIRKP